MQTPTLSPEALLRDEARARVRLISDVSYDIALDLTHGDETFECETTIRFRCGEPGAATFLDLTAPAVRSIELNGAALDPAAFTGFRFPLENLASENTLRVSATCEYSRSGTGLHFFRDPVDGNPYLHTQFEAREAHKAFPCFDQPDIKATFTLAVTAPEGWKVASNTTPVVNGQRWAFPTTKTMSTYLAAIVAGPYHVVSDKHGDIDLGIWCRQSLAQYLDADEIFEITKQGFDFFESYFAYPYMWGKYDQLFVPEFNSGAMENAGCVTFHEMMIFRSKVTQAARENRAGTILHEMAHMWFGDLVTMNWWDDLWLNESFATYMGTLAQARATRFTNAWTTFAQGQKLWAMMQDQMPTTHPIVADVPDTESARTNFDGISYAKGASVLKQLVAWVGEQPFVDGVRNYFRKHEYSNADLAKFLGTLEEASGRDLSAWSKEWLETAGVNTFRAAIETDGDAYRSVALEQTAAEGWPTLRSHRIVVGLYDLDGTRLVRRRRIELDAVGARTSIPDLTGERIADLLLVNDDDLAYTKIRLDARSLTTLTDHLADLEDPLARALCWTAATDQLRDAELAARDFVRLIVNNIHTETDPSTVGQLLAQAQEAFTLYGDPANRDDARLALATRALAQLKDAEPASDLQLLWARTFISTARTDAHLAIVRGLLDEAVPFEGLAIDTDLRWFIVRCLAGLAVIGEDEIAAELERDPTDAGQRYAAGARASQPTAAAKAQAWEAICSEQTPLATIRAHMGGFQRFDQAELIEPYREPYFESLQRMWDTRPVEVAATFAGSMYPIALLGEELVARTDEYLEANPSSPPPIRRALLEDRDQVVRALRARRVDIAAGNR